MENCAEKLQIPLHKVENYHSEDAKKMLREANADLGILYGTNIIKEDVFSIPRLGSINIHQGLAPIYRGGPTVFWELFNGEKELGITVHFVAAKVDTGDIILQKTVPLDYDFSRYDLDYEEIFERFSRRFDRTFSAIDCRSRKFDCERRRATNETRYELRQALSSADENLKKTRF